MASENNEYEQELEIFTAAGWLIFIGILCMLGAYWLELLFLGIVGIVCIGIGGGILYLMKLDRAKKVKERDIEIETTIKELYSSIEPHRHALKRNLERALIINDYGAIAQDNQDEVVKEFMTSVGLDWDVIDTEIAKEIITEELAEWEEKDREAGFDSDTLPTDGLEFEHWVAEGLNKFGWDARATSGSGDQGIDVIATKNGKKVGLQCKLLSSAVGNKAVQEAHAGKDFHQMDVVGVITNSSYTKSAKALAADTGVKLLSHHDIPNLYEKMFD